MQAARIARRIAKTKLEREQRQKELDRKAKQAKIKTFAVVGFINHEHGEGLVGSVQGEEQCNVGGFRVQGNLNVRSYLSFCKSLNHDLNQST